MLSLPLMTENIRLKELDTNVKKILKLIEKRNHEYISRFSLIEVTLEDLTHKQVVSGSNSNTSGGFPPPPFQVRKVKLDFPRFDGSKVLHWIFKAEQFRLCSILIFSF